MDNFKIKLLAFLNSDKFLLIAIGVSMIIMLNIGYIAGKSENSKALLTQDQALAQADQYCKDVFNFIISDPRFQSEEARQELARMFPLVRESIRQYIKWLYDGRGYVVKKKSG